ncbi:hypothetical protein Q5752_004898 [Cryptotrichosporon argae]
MSRRRAGKARPWSRKKTTQPKQVEHDGSLDNPNDAIPAVLSQSSVEDLRTNFKQYKSPWTYTDSRACKYEGTEFRTGQFVYIRGETSTFNQPEVADVFTEDDHCLEPGSEPFWIARIDQIWSPKCQLQQVAVPADRHQPEGDMGVHHDSATQGMAFRQLTEGAIVVSTFTEYVSLVCVEDHVSVIASAALTILPSSRSARRATGQGQ